MNRLREVFEEITWKDWIEFLGQCAFVLITIIDFLVPRATE